MVQRNNKATPVKKPRGPYKVKDERITLAADSLSLDRPNDRRKLKAKDAMRAASSTEAECNTIERSNSGLGISFGDCARHTQRIPK